MRQGRLFSGNLPAMFQNIVTNFADQVLNNDLVGDVQQNNDQKADASTQTDDAERVRFPKN